MISSRAAGGPLLPGGAVEDTLNEGTRPEAADTEDLSFLEPAIQPDELGPLVSRFLTSHRGDSAS